MRQCMFECPVCLKRSNSAFKDVNRHMAQVHQGGGYSADKSLFYLAPSDYDRVIKRRRQTMIEEWNTWSCVMCKNVYSKCRDLRAHMNLEHINRKVRGIFFI